jgi:hypothetical protein
MNNFSQNIDNMVSKILNEEITKKTKEMVNKIEEELKGGQKKLDKNKNGRLDSADFKMLRSMKKKETKEEKKVCEQCGGGMTEGECSECGYSSMREDWNEEVEEGNAFSGALNKAKEEGKKSFEVDGKTYPVREGKEKWIQKTNMKKGALHKKLGIPEDETIPVSKLKSLKKELQAKGEGDKKMSAADLKLLKQVNMALNLKSIKENRNSLQLTETEMVDLIESLVVEQKKKEETEVKVQKVTEKLKDNISKKYVSGLAKMEKNLKASKKGEEDYIKSVTAKMKDYLKTGSKGDYEMNPTQFPMGNGELGEMDKKAYKASDAVEEYIQAFAYPGLEDNHYDEIKPNEEWMEKNIEGSSETGNNPKWANAVETGLGKRVNEKRKKALYDKEKQRSYNRVKQPVDQAGESSGEKTLDKMFAKLESMDEKSEKLINEEFDKMKHLMGYNKKTQ